MIQRQDILNKTESFKEFMENLDAQLIRDSIPIPNRPIHAFARIADAGITMIFAGGTKDECGEIVHDWFTDRYGKKLNIDFSIGRSIVLIRDDPYVMKIPLILGEWDGIVEVEKTFEGFTKSYFAALKEKELDNIISLFANHKKSFEQIDRLPSDVKAALKSTNVQQNI
jgi:hypothetical protein